MNIRNIIPSGLPATLTWRREDEADDLLLAIEQNSAKALGGSTVRLEASTPEGVQSAALGGSGFG